MRRFVRLLVVVLALVMVAGVSPAIAGAGGASHKIEATFTEGHGFPPNYDTEALADRGCPEASEWIFSGEGSGEMTSAMLDLDDKPFDYEFDYCSRFVAFDPERTTGRYVGKAEAGQMTITVDDDELRVAFEGTWTFDGALAPPDFTANLRLHYTIMGGTGMFDGAGGHGRLFLKTTVDALGGVDTMAGVLNGSIHQK